jgi:hypothetical protein
MVRKSKYTEELLRPIVEDSTSMAQVITKLGLKLTGGNYRNISQHISNLSISTDHFNGHGWALGKNKYNDARVARMAASHRLKNSEVFIKNAKPIGGATTRRRAMKREERRWLRLLQEMGS